MIDQAAAGLLMTIAETPGGKIAASVLNDFYPRQGKQLMQTNLLAPLGDTFAAPLDLDHGDEPLPLIWSGEHGCFGYYNPAAVWITVPSERLTMFGINMAVLLAHIVKDLDVSGGTGSKSLVDDVLWELGDAKIRNRRQRLPIWFARRLSDRDCWQKVEDLTKRRPHDTIRIIVTSTPYQRLFSDALAGHLIVNLADVITADFGLAIRPEILVARLDGAPVVDVNTPLWLSPDGQQLIFHGRVKMDFKSVPQKRIIATLVQGFYDRKRFRLGELLSSDSAAPKRLADVFGKTRWAELAPYLKSANGLWGFEL
ncbi:MAG: hypothetical protein WCY11_11800 [Novosphingobium sp.]